MQGLIRYRIVIHGFIDGYARLALGMRASNNNRAQTVLDLFDSIAAVHGYPSRARGDYGTENVLVANRMNEVRGLRRGSYIYGRYVYIPASVTVNNNIFSRSVHNIRIERLWVDVTRGFGRKWKDLFRLLETTYGLNVDNERHLWLLHYLFLNRINDDIEAWIGSWNHHTLSSRTQTYQTPSVMYQQGMIQHGFRGVFPEPEGDRQGDQAYADYGE